MSTQPLLEIQDLSTHFVSAGGARVVRAVNEVSFTLRAVRLQRLIDLVPDA